MIIGKGLPCLNVFLGQVPVRLSPTAPGGLDDLLALPNTLLTDLSYD